MGCSSAYIYNLDELPETSSSDTQPPFLLFLHNYFDHQHHSFSLSLNSAKNPYTNGNYKNIYIHVQIIKFRN